jgi:toxin FitB
MSAVANPRKSERLFAWVERLNGADFVKVDMSWQVADAYARLISERRLKFLWTGDPRQKSDKVGHDLMIAANSIAYSMPIATHNVRDYLAIQECIPLPGLYDPVAEKWYVEPRRADSASLDPMTQNSPRPIPAI